MYSVSDEVKALALAPSRHICPYVTVASRSSGTWVYDRVYRDTDNLVSVNIDIGSNSGGLIIGAAYSAKLTLRLMGAVSISQKDHIIVRVRFYKEGVEQPYDISLGGYFVDTITKKDQLTTIVAYDKMLRGAKLYKPTALTFPCRLSAILGDICDKMEISLRSGVTMPYDPVINSAPVRGKDSDGNTLYYTRREMLAYIASLMGGNWFFDPGGKLAFTQFAEVSDVFAAENSTAADISSDAYTVAGISWNVNGVSYSRYDDVDATGVLEFTTPLDVDAKEPIIGALEQRLVGITYHGGTVQRQGCGWFELGDIVTAARKDGSTAKVLITGINYSISGGAFTEKIYSSALTDSQSNYTSGDVTGQSVPQSVAQEEALNVSGAVMSEYEYLTDTSVKFNGTTYTVEKDSTTGLISKISDNKGNEFKPTLNSGIADVTLHNAVFWAVAMCRGISSAKLPQPVVELTFENSLANTGTGNYSVTSSGQMDYTTGITGDVYCYSAIYQSEVVVSGLSDVLNGDFTAVVWFKKNPYSGNSRLIWFTFNDLYYGVEFQGSACRALGAGFTSGNYADVEWHSCAIVKSGSRFATVFDGEETLTCDIGITSNSGVITLSWNSAEFFHGYIDSLRLYGRALTDDELKKVLALK